MNLEEAKTNETYNKVFARGKIVGFGKNDYGMKRFILYVKGRIAQDREKNPLYMSIVFGNEVSRDFRVGDMVEVEGHMIAYPYKNEVWDRWGYIQYVVADSIEVCRPELSRVFGIEGGFAIEKPCCRIYLKGTVTNKYTKEGSSWHRFTVLVDDDKKNSRSNRVRVQYSDRMRVSEVEYEEGDRITVIGVMSSSIKGKDKEIRYFENVIADDMAVYEKKTEEARESFAEAFGDFEEMEELPSEPEETEN